MFTSYSFLVFATLFFLSYWAIPRAGFRRILLLASCGLFYYYFAGPTGVAPILVLGAATYLAARFGGRISQVGAIVLNVGALLFYKYTIFLTEQVLGYFDPNLASAAVARLHAPPWSVVPPLAISFFVFEFVHYLVEVLHGKTSIRSLLNFSLFALFFPTVVAGPIKRFDQFLPALEQGLHTSDSSEFVTGLARVTVGLIKKLVIADFLTGAIDAWQPHFSNLPLTYRWIILVAIALRILFDFSGYSDIAIGLGQMMGIKVPENFNWPYLATSVQDFWRRWHISLSSWIRDYVYIPLGGSKQGVPRKIANGLIAFALCGMWHGASWHFALWGIYHGVGLIISSNYSRALGRSGQWMESALEVAFPVKWAMTQFFVMVGWLYFFFPINEANKMLLSLFGH